MEDGEMHKKVTVAGRELKSAKSRGTQERG
jgi:hypothetical protein